jgi:isoquinoline 1-oxidoreductase beta subunit
VSLSRREFLVTSAAAAAGSSSASTFLSRTPLQTRRFGDQRVVVVRPDDTVVIRIARSEMGQGTLTGPRAARRRRARMRLAQGHDRIPTPGENLARKRRVGHFSTGGSRGIRDRTRYVRKGGAAARMMLVQAAAMDGRSRLPNARRPTA